MDHFCRPSIHQILSVNQFGFVESDENDSTLVKFYPLQIECLLLGLF